MNLNLNSTLCVIFIQYKFYTKILKMAVNNKLLYPFIALKLRVSKYQTSRMTELQ